MTLTSGCVSLLLMTMLAWSPPTDSAEVRPVVVKLQDFRGTWHTFDDTRRKKLVVEVTFRYGPPAGTKAVYLAGTFNDWKPNALKMDGPDDSGRYQTRRILDAGAHEYKFVLGGTGWRQDPGNARQIGDYHNSVVEVGKSR